MGEALVDFHQECVVGAASAGSPESDRAGRTLGIGVVGLRALADRNHRRLHAINEPVEAVIIAISNIGMGEHATHVVGRDDQVMRHLALDADGRLIASLNRIMAREQMHGALGELDIPDVQAIGGSEFGEDGGGFLLL